MHDERSRSGEVYAWSLGVGWEVFRGVRLGVATDLLDGTVVQDTLFTAEDQDRLDPVYARITFDDRLTRFLSATRIRIGVDLGITPEWNLGATVTLPGEWEIREEWSFRTRLEEDDGSVDRDLDTGVLDYSWHVPAVWTVGTAFRRGKLRFFGTIRYTDWTQAEYRPVPAQDIPRTLFRRSYAATVDGGLGVAYRFHRTLVVRAGWERYGNPYRWIGGDSVATVWSAGFSQRVGRSLWLDLSYRFTVSPALAVESERIEELRAHRLALGVRVAF